VRFAEDISALCPDAVIPLSLMAKLVVLSIGEGRNFWGYFDEL
jgi:hypothetical protein